MTTLAGISLDLGRWFWSPGFGRSAWLCGVILIIITVCFAVRSVWWRQSSGPASASERRILQGKSSFKSLLLGCMSALAVFFPFCLAAGVVLMVFQPSRRVALLLISRESQAITPGKAWLDAAGEAVRHDAVLLDVGRVSDRALTLLQKANLPGLSIKDDRVKTTMVYTVKTAVAEAVRGEIDKFHLESPDRISIVSAPAISGPLVQAIEMACLRLLVERFNTGHIIVLGGARRDALGLDPWMGATNYLRPGNRGFFRPLEVQIIDDPLPAGVSLISAELLDSSRMALSFRLTSVIAPTKETVRITNCGPPTNLEFTLGHQSQLHLRVLDLPAGTPEPAYVRAEYSNRPAEERSVGSLNKAWSNKTIHILCPATWSNAIAEIVFARTNGHWWFQKAADRLLSSSGGLLPANTKILINGAPPAAGSLVINFNQTGGVLEYLALAPGLGTNPSPPVTGGMSAGVAASQLWSRGLASDSIFSFPNFQLPPLPLNIPAGGRLGIEVFAAEASRIADGAEYQSQNDQPFVTVFPDTRAADRFSCVWIGLDADSAKFVSPAALLTNDMKASVFWSAAIDAALMCLRPSRQIPVFEPASTQLTLLSNSDIEAEKAAVYASGSIILIGGLVLAAFWSLTQVFLSRRN